MVGSDDYSAEFAALYDRLVQESNYFNYDDIVSSLDVLLESRENVLELGVGTGNVAIPLSRLGYTVSGIDNSDHMLSICREKSALAGVDLSLYGMDASTFSIPAKFNAVYSNSGPLIFFNTPDGVFLDVASEEKKFAILSNVTRHLENGGLLIVNIENEEEWNVMLSNGVRYERKFQNSGKNAIRTHTFYNGAEAISSLRVECVRFGMDEVRADLQQRGFSDFTVDADRGFVYCTYSG